MEAIMDCKLKSVCIRIDLSRVLSDEFKVNGFEHALVMQAPDGGYDF